MEVNPEISSPLNEALKSLYWSKWEEIQKIRADFKLLSKPYLAWAHPNYLKASVRLVVVGKETNGWGKEENVIDGVDAEKAVTVMMHAYKTFGLGEQYKYGKGSFWTPVHELYRKLNPGGLDNGFMALNASFLDQEGRQPNDKMLEAVVATGLLKEEIRILQPDIVVFFTGPRYDSTLKKWFPDIEIVGDKWFSRLRSQFFPFLCLKTYHPQYLNRKSKRTETFERICEAMSMRK